MCCYLCLCPLPLLTGGCCGCSLRTCCLLIGYIHGIVPLVIRVAVWVLAARSPSLYAASTIWTVLFNVLLVIGVHADKRVLVKLHYMFYMCMCCVNCCIMLFMFVTLNPLGGTYVLLTIIIDTFVIIIVRSYYFQMRWDLAEEEQSEQAV